MDTSILIIKKINYQIASVDIIDNFKEIKKDIEKISYVSFILELTNQVIKQNNDEEIFDICVNAIKK